MQHHEAGANALGEPGARTPSPEQAPTDADERQAQIGPEYHSGGLAMDALSSFVSPGNPAINRVIAGFSTTALRG